MGIPDHIICLLRNLYAGQEATVWIRCGTMTGSKLGKEYDKAIYCHAVYLTYMQSTSFEMLGWMSHKLESRLPGEISRISIIRWHHPYGNKWRGTEEPLRESERGEWKSRLKTQHSKNKDHGIRSHARWQIDGERMETVTDFIFLGFKGTVDGDCSHEIRRCLLLARKAMSNLAY